VSAAEQTKSTMAASIEQQSSGGYSLVTGARALANGTQSLADAVPALTSGVAQLKNGSAELVSNNQKLNDGVNALSDGTDAVIDGVDQLSDGAHQLADGIVTFNEEGIEKILNSYHGDIEPLMDRIQAVLDAGEDYQTYTDIADGVNGSIKFIYKTDAVKED
jgi:putative membrane protein